MKKILAIVITLSTLSACNSKVPKDAKIVKLPTNQEEVSSNKNDSNFTIGNFSLNIPGDWEQVAPSNNMRIAEFKITEHPDFPIVVSFFGNMGNNTDANIERWKAQFSKLESTDKLKLSVKNLVAVKLIGSYNLKPFPMAQNFVETPNYGMLAAIIPSPEGPYFLKITAPKDVIESQTEIFKSVLNSYK